MKLRISFARFLIHLGRWIQLLAVTVMKPDNQIEFSRQNYSMPNEVKTWSDKQWIESGLTHEEDLLVKKLPIEKGNLLILGTGGGREAIFFAQKGINVTVVDFIPEMIEETRKNAKAYGVKINVIHQEISELKTPDNHYDFIWASMGLYSSVSTKKRRVKMLKDLYRTLKPGGHIFCMFH